MKRVAIGLGGALALANISAEATISPSPPVPDRQLARHSARALGRELLRRNANASEILRVRELAGKYLSGGRSKDFSPQLQVAVSTAPMLMGPAIPCRHLRIRIDQAFPSNYLPALVIDGPWCLTADGWQATTLKISGAFPKAPSQLPRPWDNHGLETTTLVVTPTQG